MTWPLQKMLKLSSHDISVSHSELRGIIWLPSVQNSSLIGALLSSHIWRSNTLEGSGDHSDHNHVDHGRVGRSLHVSIWFYLRRQPFTTTWVIFSLKITLVVDFIGRSTGSRTPSSYLYVESSKSCCFNAALDLIKCVLYSYIVFSSILLSCTQKQSSSLRNEPSFMLMKWAQWKCSDVRNTRYSSF
jgi:hypothetical protein